MGQSDFRRNLIRACRLPLASLLAAAGCASNAELTVRQPFAPPSQQVLKLTGERAYYATSDHQQTSVLTFPLPGAVAGPRAFVLYLTGPNRSGTVGVAPDDPQSARGFLIQELGKLAGRSDFASGTLSYRDVPFRHRLRHLKVDLRTEDGAVITGAATLEESPKAVESIEREFAGDVASLQRLPTAEPAEAPDTNIAP
jgi:hypothetical protein